MGPLGPFKPRGASLGPIGPHGAPWDPMDTRETPWRPTWPHGRRMERPWDPMGPFGHPAVIRGHLPGIMTAIVSTHSPSKRTVLKHRLDITSGGAFHKLLKNSFTFTCLFEP